MGIGSFYQALNGVLIALPFGKQYKLHNNYNLSFINCVNDVNNCIIFSILATSLMYPLMSFHADTIMVKVM